MYYKGVYMYKVTPQSRATTISRFISKLVKVIKHNSYLIKGLERRQAKARNIRSPAVFFTGEDALQLRQLRRNNVQLKRKLSILIKRSEALFK